MLKEAVAAPLPKHLLFAWWSSHALKEAVAALYQNIYYLLGGVLMR